MKPFFALSTAAVAVASACLLIAAPAQADVVTDWNSAAGDVIVQARIGTPPATRIMAIVQTAVLEAVDAVARQQPADPVAASSAAVAAATRASLAKLLPQQEGMVQQLYRDELAKLPPGSSVAAGLAAGEQAAARVLAWRAEDGFAAPERYRPHAAPGAYVPTAAVAAPQWAQRKPWVMTDSAQFRPGPPPAMDSSRWERDFNEVKALGSKASTQRTPLQTEVARFWEFSLPPIYQGVVRSVALVPGRTVAQNARLFAAASQAMDDALIAVLDAKYHHGFWRPVTAIRNADRDPHPGTTVDPGWTALIDNPGHPEYPSAHSILAGAVGAVVRHEVGAGRMPRLSTSSPTGKDATRSWNSVEEFMQEVADARVWEGIHFRFSTEVGLDMGRQIGALAARRVAQSPPLAALPLALMPPGRILVEAMTARGVQVYECRANTTAPAGWQWTFVGPEAALFDGSGAKVGKHYAGPHWEAADGSRIAGTVDAKMDAPQTDAIAWLLLSAKPGDVRGRFGKVSHIARINTVGGSVPPRDCNAAAGGQVEKVPYTADYLLFS